MVIISFSGSDLVMLIWRPSVAWYTPLSYPYIEEFKNKNYKRKPWKFHDHSWSHAIYLAIGLLQCGHMSYDRWSIPSADHLFCCSSYAGIEDHEWPPKKMFYWQFNLDIIFWIFCVVGNCLICQMPVVASVSSHVEEIVWFAFNQVSPCLKYHKHVKKFKPSTCSSGKFWLIRNTVHWNPILVVQNIKILAN